MNVIETQRIPHFLKNILLLQTVKNKGFLLCTMSVFPNMDLHYSPIQVRISYLQTLQYLGSKRHIPP